MELRQLRAVLFDMDGTLVTSDAAVERAWTTCASEYGVDITHGKPAPEGYLHAAESLGVDPKYCLVVEDAEVGPAAGRAAGAQTAALKGLDGDIRLRDLHELAALLNRSGE
ncbi:HAD-IA family hydrolase [Streptomyces sp. SID13031]|uniref:HAD-IA family hydrolase n=1 Tax=Streptomyces sp. SID13031 TaxID=2706046 RepID=UPI0013CAC6BC|nr:HAD-IA family hydrolase [Streptomyces sp. SID13031]NEA35255.1 HAD-IA family hydrolase [Streptomyces sp. SID13031]